MSSRSTTYHFPQEPSVTLARAGKEKADNWQSNVDTDLNRFYRLWEVGSITSGHGVFRGRRGYPQSVHATFWSKTRRLSAFPIAFKEEEDPSAHISLRVFPPATIKEDIPAPNNYRYSSLGAVTKGRDAFEYRQTRLVPEEDLYIPFSKNLSLAILLPARSTTSFIVLVLFATDFAKWPGV